MAINFPSTQGQPIDGTFTYVVSGITYSWNGESWRAAGGGATATDLTVFSVINTAAAGSGALAYNSNTGEFGFTPPDLSSYLTLYGPVSNHSDVTITNPQADQVLRYNAANLAWENWTPNYLTSYTETDPVFTASPVGSVTTTQVSNWDTAYGWGDHASAGYLTSLPSRTTSQITAASLPDGSDAAVSITTPPAYALLKIETSHAAWVTLYTDTTSRTNDAGRSETTDPTPGSGVIAEVITAGPTTQLISPGTIAYNANATGTTYAKVVNKSGATANITVTLTYIKLEA